MELRPYQIRCLDAMEEAAQRGVTRQLVVSCVGSGKTVLLAKRLERLGFPKTYALMHRTELLKQMRGKFLEVNPALKIGLDKAESRPSPEADDVILTSVQSVGRIDKKRLELIPKDWPKVVAVDEVHHAPSESFLTVLDHFGLRGEDPRRDILSIGLTATPERLDELGYDQIFDDVVFRYGLRDGIKEGWLADIRAWRIRTNIDLSGVKSTGSDFSEKSLDCAMNTQEHNKIAAETWAAHCRGRRSLVFCVTKVHAHAVCEEFGKAGAKAAVVVAETPDDVRAASIQALKDGSLEALVNVGVMTEGVDIPEVDCIHILRPTKSQGLLTQMTGRGVRKAPGKDYMELFDYAGHSHDIASIGRVFGLPDSWSLEGQSVLGDVEDLEEAVEDLGISMDGLRGMKDLRQKLNSREERVQLIKGSLKAADLPSALVWLKPSAKEERYVIAWRNETREEVDRMKELKYQLKATQAMEPKNLFGVCERIEVFRNELGKYEGVIYRRLGSERKEVRIGSDSSLAKLTGKIEGWIIDKRPHKAGLMKKSAKWAREPASPGQLGVLKRKGIPKGFLEAGALTKREASILMGLPNNRVRALFQSVF